MVVHRSSGLVWVEPQLHELLKSHEIQHNNLRKTKKEATASYAYIKCVPNIQLRIYNYVVCCKVFKQTINVIFCF